MRRAPIRAGQMLLAVSLVVLFGAGIRFFRIAPLETPISPEPANRSTEDIRFVQPLSASDGEIEMALEASPFSSDRQRPTVRFGEFAAGPAEVEIRTDIRNVRLLGTTLAGAQSFALVEQRGQPAKLVKLDETYLGFKISQIARGKVVLSSRDSTFVIDLNRGQ